MKHMIAIAFSLVSGFALSATAQTPAAAPPAKIAVVAFQAAVGQTNEFQRNFADLQKKYEPKESQLKTLNEEIESLKKQLQTQGASLSEAERTTRTKAIDDKEKKLKRSAEDAQADFKNEMQQMFNGVAGKVFDVLSSYSREQGYTLVLDVSQQQTPVLYAVESTNITKPVIDAYNVKSGVPAPPAPPAQPGAAVSAKPAAPAAKPPAAH
jgi:outer membrane protein